MGTRQVAFGNASTGALTSSGNLIFYDGYLSSYYLDIGTYTQIGGGGTTSFVRGAAANFTVGVTNNNAYTLYTGSGYIGNYASIYFVMANSIGFGTDAPTRFFDVTSSKNGDVVIRVENKNGGRFAFSGVEVISATGKNGYFYKTSDNYDSYGDIINAGDMVVQNNDAGNLVLWNSKNTGEIRMAAGGSSTYQLRVKSDGLVMLKDLEVFSAIVKFSSLPTSSSGLEPGRVWNNSGILNIIP